MKSFELRLPENKDLTSEFSMRHYFILTGPTGTGKSRLGFELAQDFDCPILTIDSMQVYRKMDIGSAKPNLEERRQVRHELLDVVEPSEAFDVSKFLELAEKSYDAHRGKLIGVGGTIFYIKALAQGLSRVETLPAIEKKLSKLKGDLLRVALERLDPKRSQAILANDRFRLERALSIILSTGRKASSFQQQPDQSRSKLTLVALNCERTLMHKRLKLRIDHMFEQGLLEEVRELYESGNLSESAAAGVNYKELYKYFDGEWDLETAKEKMLVATRRLFKHQMTWLRKMPVEWIDVHPDRVEKALPRLKELLSQHFEKMSLSDV